MATMSFDENFAFRRSPVAARYGILGSHTGKSNHEVEFHDGILVQVGAYLHNERYAQITNPLKGLSLCRNKLFFPGYISGRRSPLPCKMGNVSIRTEGAFVVDGAEHFIAHVSLVAMS